MVMIGGSIGGYLVDCCDDLAKNVAMNNYCKNATEATDAKIQLKNLSMAIMMSTIVMGVVQWRRTATKK